MSDPQLPSDPESGGQPPQPPPPPPGAAPPPGPTPPPAFTPPPATQAAAGAPGGAVGTAYSVSDAFNYAWKKFQQNAGPWILACLAAVAAMAILTLIYVVALIPLVAANVTEVETRNGTTTYDISTGGGIGAVVLSILFGLAITLLGWIISAQFVRAALANTKMGTIQFGVFLKKELLGPIIVAAFLLALIQVVLQVIGIVPLIGWLIQFIGSIVVTFFAQFYAYFVLDQGKSPVDAIKGSFAFVNSHLASIIVLFLASFVALFIGALLCGVGLLVAIPVTALAHAYTYRVLRNEPVAA